MAMLRRLGVLLGIPALAPVFAAGAWAQGGPRNWQMGLPEPASTSMERLVEFHDLLLWIITLIALFVLGLLLYVMYRFAENRNPNPSRTTHNTLLEVLWTTIPVIILVGMAIPSFKLLYFVDKVENADMTIKAIGRQWYWSYEYPDHGDFTFDAVLIEDEDLEEGQKRLLETDVQVVLPVNTKIRLLVTASDVLHNFAMPAFGIKMDAVPGRVNETWFDITREGTYYGQCSEICGTGHAYMPITIKAVSKEAFADWVEQAKVEFARGGEPPAPTRLAQTQTAQ